MGFLAGNWGGWARLEEWAAAAGLPGPPPPPARPMLPTHTLPLPLQADIVATILASCRPGAELSAPALFALLSALARDLRTDFEAHAPALCTAAADWLDAGEGVGRKHGRRRVGGQAGRRREGSGGLGGTGGRPASRPLTPHPSAHPISQAGTAMPTSWRPPIHAWARC